MPRYTIDDYGEFVSELSADLLRNRSLSETTVYRNYGPEEKIEEFLQRMQREGLIKREHPFPGTRFESITYGLTQQGVRNLKNSGYGDREVWAGAAIDSWEE